MNATNDTWRDDAAAIEDAFCRLGNEINRCVMPALDNFGRAYYAFAERTYLGAHGTLPGSDRNARLRKKRRDAILRWFEREIGRK